MRKRKEIEKDGTDKRQLQLEVLLDIRDMLQKSHPKRKYTKRKENG